MASLHSLAKELEFRIECNERGITAINRYGAVIFANKGPGEALLDLSDRVSIKRRNEGKRPWTEVEKEQPNYFNIQGRSH